MRKYLFIILISLCCFSCVEDFLEESDKDKIIPKTVQDYEELLYGEAYTKDKAVMDYLDYMTDDVVSKSGSKGWFGVTDNRISIFGYYAWQQNPEIKTNSGINEDGNWRNCYKSILICNIVIDNILNGSTTGSQADKNRVMAEAYFQRAFHYFILVNLYGEPYDKATATTALGVPINNLVGMENIKLDRAPLQKVYDLIIKDLDKSIELFTDNDNNGFYKANLKATLLLASRVALYTQDYAKCVEYSTALINKGASLVNFKDFTNDDFFLSRKNTEILYTYGYNNIMLASAATYSFAPSNELIALLKEKGSLRSKVFIKKIGTGYFAKTAFQKSNESDITGVYGQTFRSAEAYLNRAEANIKLKEIGKAIVDINYLRSTRFDSNVEISAANENEALALVRKEKRAEFCGELHRWFDLRRIKSDERPVIEHTYITDYKTKEFVTYVLEKDDVAYTLPLPMSVSEFDTHLKNINRPSRNPIK